MVSPRESKGTRQKLENLIFDDPEDDASFLLFGAGSRVCVGKDFVMRTMVTILACLIQQFEVRLFCLADSSYLVALLLIHVISWTSYKNSVFSCLRIYYVTNFDTRILVGPPILASNTTTHLFSIHFTINIATGIRLFLNALCVD